MRVAIASNVLKSKFDEKDLNLKFGSFNDFQFLIWYVILTP